MRLCWAHLSTQNTDKSLAILLSDNSILSYVSSKSVVVLPPYWFSLDALDSIPLKDRIEKLVEMREKINDEIFCLKSIVAKQPANSI